MKNGENSLKKVDYTKLSNKKCVICGRPLKQNVVNKNPNACLCFVCFKLSQGKHYLSKKGQKINLYNLHLDNCRIYGGSPKFLKPIDLFSTKLK